MVDEDGVSREVIRAGSVELDAGLACVRAGVAFPSESLAALGYRPEFDANKLADFVSHFAVAATHDEEGHPLSESRIPLAHEPVEEDDLELTYRESSVGA